MKFLGAIALTGVFLLPSIALAACDADGATVVYVNGVFTNEKQARADARNLGIKYLNLTGDSKVNFINGYNPSHLAGLGDLAQAAAQIREKSISNYDRNTILLQIHPQLTTRKLLLVGHSQGAFYSNALYDYLVDNGEPESAVGVYQVGSPASYVAGGGTYLNSSGDFLLGALRDLGLKFLPDNIDLVSYGDDSRKIFYGHSFSGAYLAEAPDRIVGDMQGMLKKLKADSSSDTGECFAAPATGLGYKATKAGFTVADTAAAGIRAGAGVATRVAMAAGNALAFAAQSAYGIASKVAADIGITVGGAVGISHAADPSKAETNFSIFSKLYGSSIPKEEYKDLMGGAVATAPIFAATPAPAPAAQPAPVQQIAPVPQSASAPQISILPAGAVMPLLSGSGGARHRRSSSKAPEPEVSEPETPELPPVDTVPPVFAAVGDVSREAGEDGIEISYTLPVAQDGVDGPVAVSCDPAQGALFALGTTTVSCNAHDAAGNVATTTFSVNIFLRQPQIFVIASQEDESHVCSDEFWGGWRNCYVGPEESVYTTDLGTGLSGALDSLTLSKDRKDGSLNLFHSYLITIECFTDGTYATPCTDWVMPDAGNGNRSDAVMQTTFSVPSGDGIHWVAYFVNNESRHLVATFPKDFNGNTPVMFNPAYYYRLNIDDRGWPSATNGSATDPYWVLRGVK